MSLEGKKGRKEGRKTSVGPNQTAARRAGMPRMKICDAPETNCPRNEIQKRPASEKSFSGPTRRMLMMTTDQEQRRRT